MTTRSLAQFLLERGAITNDMLTEALEYQRESIKPMCDAAVKSGKETRRELAQLEAKAAGAPLTKDQEEMLDRLHSLEQLEATWRTLAERGTFLMEALVRQGHFTQEEMDTLYDDYRAGATPEAINLESVLPDEPETREILESLIDIAIELFTRYTKEKPQILSIKRELPELDPKTRAFLQNISGDLSVRYALVMPPGLMRSVVLDILEEKDTPSDTISVGALTEIVNVMVGNTCAKFSMRNYKVQADVPQALRIDEFKAMLDGPPIVVHVKAKGGEFCLVYLVA